MAKNIYVEGRKTKGKGQKTLAFRLQIKQKKK